MGFHWGLFHIIILALEIFRLTLIKLFHKNLSLRKFLINIDYNYVSISKKFDIKLIFKSIEFNKTYHLQKNKKLPSFTNS